MNVILVGGNGFIGRNLAEELVDRDHDVTVLSRSPDPQNLPDGVEVSTGDVTAYDSILPAFEGQDAVVNLVALSPLFKPKGGGDPHDAVHRGGTEHCVRAAEEHGVDRFVQLSGVFADPDADTAYLRAKGRAEEIVRDADLGWVIVRPTIVFGDGDEFADFVTLLTTPYVTGLPGGGKVQYQPIWIGDATPILADCVEADDRAGETYEIAGPERISLAEVTRLIYRSRGKSVRILPIPTVLARVGLTVADPLPFVPLGADQAKSMDVDLVVRDNEVDAFGVEESDLRTYGDYLGVA
ncbi:complex I NDUFA9 subunit family protein [Halobacteriales archaeon Cl-PHB]